MLKVFTSKSTALMLILLISLTAQSQGITVPRTPSPAAIVAQKVGISTITINYSRLTIKGREVWGKLVPYGWNVQVFGAHNEAPWRAGANENTTLQLSHDAMVQGQKVPAGTYGLFFVINKDNTGEFILSKDNKSWGSFWYDKKQDQLRQNIQLRTIPQLEQLTFDFINNNKTSTELVLNWERKQFPVKIEFAVDDIVMANAIEELKGPVGFNWQGYVSAANYALQNKIDYDLALQWIDLAITQNNAFPTLNVKSNLLKAKGETAEAARIMNDAIAVSTENELNAYGYQLLGEGNNDKAIEVFLLNTQRHPKSANVFDSLGEGYATKGDKKNAIMSFKKSLSLNPNAGTKANSEKFLRVLGAL